jgi:predicted Fe-S protein YdhL (DUF1289 family)
MSGRVRSPCNDVCQLDRRTGWCFGCGRSGDEIMRWLRYSDAERDAVMASLPARLAQMGLPEDAEERRLEGERRARAQRLAS